MLLVICLRLSSSVSFSSLAAAMPDEVAALPHARGAPPPAPGGLRALVGRLEKVTVSKSCAYVNDSVF